MPSAALIVPDAATGGTPSRFPSLDDLTSLLGDQLGLWLEDVVSDTVPGGEPGRWVLCDALKDDEHVRAQLAGGWVYVLSGEQRGASRRIRDEGYEGPYGAVALARVLDGNLSADTVVAFSDPLPVVRTGLVKGLREIIVEAADRIRVEVRLPLTGNGTHRQDLSAWPFVQSLNDTDGVYDSRWLAGAYPTRRSVQQHDITTNGALITLETQIAYSGTEAFELKAFCPASRLTNDSGVWGYDPDGPSDGLDQVAAPSGWVLPIAMTIALDYLTARAEADATMSDADRARLVGSYRRRLAERWGPAAQQIIRRMLPRKATDPPRQIVTVAGGLIVHGRAHWHR